MSEQPRPRRLGLLRFSATLAAFVLVALFALVAGRDKPAHGSRTPTIATEPPPTVGPAAKPAPTHQQLGVNVNRLFNDGTYSTAQIGAQLAAVRATGATLARSDALWEAAEPNGPTGGVHHYDWRFDDLIAGSLAARGLQWLPILDYSAHYQQSLPGQDHSAPRDRSAFADWAAAFAARYGTGGSFWREHHSLRALPVLTYEVWNEPDNPQFWLPAPNAPYYAELYLQTRDAIAAVDPGARVIVGGLTNPMAFIPAMLHARPDLAGHVDGVAIHPYGANPFIVLERVHQARQVLDSVGMSTVPLYVTEFGWTTSPAGALSYVPEQTRPGYIASTLSTLGHTDCGIAAVLLYTWVTPETSVSNHEDWFGIAPPSVASGPGSVAASTDVSAFATGLAKAAAPAPTVPLCATSG